jgi:hypothetical protein
MSYWFILYAIKLPDLTPFIAVANGLGLVLGLVIAFRWSLLFDQVLSFITAGSSYSLSTYKTLPIVNNGRSNTDDEEKGKLMRQNWFIVCMSISAYGASSRASLWHRLPMDSWELTSFYLQDFCVCMFYYFLFNGQLALSASRGVNTEGKQNGWRLLMLTIRLVIMRLPFMMFQVFGMLSGQKFMMAFLGTMLFSAFLAMLALSSARVILPNAVKFNY